MLVVVCVYMLICFIVMVALVGVHEGKGKLV